MLGGYFTERAMPQARVATCIYTYVQPVIDCGATQATGCTCVAEKIATTSGSFFKYLFYFFFCESHCSHMSIEPWRDVNGIATLQLQTISTYLHYLLYMSRLVGRLPLRLRNSGSIFKFTRVLVVLECARK